uniref:Helitron_like_N domain-containing protein n=1 Tax=Ascaris lumbricoides TaxID=6252 RepID=A0A0M3IH80_ASCLU
MDEKMVARRAKLGKIVILPTLTQGAHLVSETGRPNYFITFTTNPKWSEICEYLRKSKRCVDQSMLTARVFNRKFKEFLRDIVERKVLGEVADYVFNTEFQKRDLPHVHMLQCGSYNASRRNDEDLDAPQANTGDEEAGTNAVAVQVHFKDLPPNTKTGHVKFEWILLTKRKFRGLGV